MLLHKKTAVKADQFVPIGSTEVNSSPVSPGYWASQPEPPANPSDGEQIGGRADGAEEERGVKTVDLSEKNKKTKKGCICGEEDPECSDRQREGVRDEDEEEGKESEWRRSAHARAHHYFAAAAPSLEKWGAAAAALDCPATMHVPLWCHGG